MEYLCLVFNVLLCIGDLIGLVLLLIFGGCVGANVLVLRIVYMWFGLVCLNC